jgi:IclR family KDG regulon transcriptional repressor
MSNINTMIDRAGEILEYLYGTDASVGVSKLSTELDMPKATVFRILTTLEKWHIVDKEYHTDKYKLGMVLVKYGAKVSSNLSLVEIATPIIDELVSSINEGVYLNIEHQSYSLNVYKKLSSKSNMMNNLIPLSPLNCSASGKIFLTKKSKEDLAIYFESQYVDKRTINSLLDLSSFEKEAELFKSTGYMYDDEEYEYGLYCISMPLSYHDEIIATISVTGPKTRLEIKGIEMIEEELKSAVVAISDLIKFVDPHRMVF